MSPRTITGSQPEPAEPPDGPTAPVIPLSPLQELVRMAPYERLMQRRTLFLRGPLEDDNGGQLVASLLALDGDSDEDIQLYIDSPGGIMTGMFAIYDVIASMQSNVHTRCVGLAASAGGFLLATGTGVRSATRNARIMLHQPLGGVQGTAADIVIQARQSAFMRDRMQTILAEVTGQPEERIHNDLDRNYWLSADEAVDYGIIDEVVPTREVAAKQQLSEGPAARRGNGSAG